MGTEDRREGGLTYSMNNDQKNCTVLDELGQLMRLYDFVFRLFWASRFLAKYRDVSMEIRT